MDIIEYIDCPLMGDQYQQSQLYLKIEVRIWADEDAGVQAEPLRWELRKPNESDPIRHGERPRGSDDMWATVTALVDAEYDDVILDMIGREHGDFEPYRRDVALQKRADNEWFRRNVL